jgi:hypothetical protein
VQWGEKKEEEACMAVARDRRNDLGGKISKGSVTTAAKKEMV